MSPRSSTPAPQRRSVSAGAWLGQALLYALFAVFIGVFSHWPPYKPLAEGQALIKVSFTHTGKPVGDCRSLTPEELASLRERCGAAVFFSEELCANYFSYTAQGRAHFVLFDTAETLRCKLRLGRERGMETAFLMYPEVSDLLPELLNA